MENERPLQSPSVERTALAGPTGLSPEPSGQGADVRDPDASHPMALDARDLTLSQSLAAPAMPFPWQESDPWEAQPAREPRRRSLSELWSSALDVLRLPLHVAAIGFMAYLFAFNLSVVRGSSMAPGIFDGDRILVDQFSYMFTDIERGDIVVLQYPLDPRLDYIKRVVGLPGDEIVMNGGSLHINGELVPENYTFENDPHTRLQLTVKPGHYFVLGDNRLHSSDSREFGQVKADLVRGKVDVRLWPLERIGRIR